MTPERYMAQSMPWHMQSIEGKSQVRQFEMFAVANRADARRNTHIGGPDHGDRPQVQQFRNPADMIGMVVGQQNGG